MTRELTQRELRNRSGEIMRALDHGEEFVITRNGTPVGELHPLRRRRFMRKETLLTLFTAAPHIDYERFRADIDTFVDQNPAPRG